MKISVNDQELFTLSEVQKRVIQNDIPEEIFDEDMKRRLRWVLLEEKYQNCFRRLKDEWLTPGSDGMSKLERNGVSSIPTHQEELAELIFSQPNYKNRSQRDKEMLALRASIPASINV